ncbi:hypothetical protein KP806_18450 [Paenibacillus sp. N4]|uniref:type II toxin-antitoxin system RelE family toxin n=1 Tax=Paenibacillus vietnamensis TaxID=2590547 RepID=UPI001CD0D103|nr:hypothetical protein [Paenibacillus vietnamensis]MCA0757046.1 hypothetical protein [Paenibacillus vietnamensis]
MAASPQVVQLFQQTLHALKVDLRFKEGVIEEDLTNFDKGQLKVILAAIKKRFTGNANPHHTSTDWELHDDLKGAYKIRIMSPYHIRIVYRIIEESNCTIVHIYAIGPRADSEVYKAAKNRIDW